ncbi:MAG: hypothetical protein ACREXT_15985 [Gammaproteobacteria bacterium]
MTSRFKGIATGTDLLCDLTGVPIEATAGPTPTLVIGGASGAEVTCSEVAAGTTTPALKTGLFTFTQTALDNCLSVATVAGKTTWTCQIPAIPVPGLPQLARWRITPKAEYVSDFCVDPAAPPATFSPCYAELGTPLSALSTDFPDRDVTGDAVPDFGAAGVVFTFSSPQGILNFGPCHSGTFQGGQPVLCSQTVGTTTFATQTTGAADADLIVATDINPGSLNLKNKSSTAAFPVVFYGANDLDITQITRTDSLGNSRISIVGPTGLAQSIRIKNSSYGYVAGPNGVVDSFRDLKVQFYRGDINKPGTFIYALTHPDGVTLTVCPHAHQQVKVNFRGILNGDTSSVWIGDDDLTIFNCPAP